MKIDSICIFLFVIPTIFFKLSFPLYAQVRDDINFFSPLSWDFQTGSHVNWKISETIDKEMIDWLQFSSVVNFKSFNFFVSDVVYFSENQTQTSEFFQTYIHVPKVYRKSTFIPDGTNVYIKAGLLRWYPKYTDIIQLSEKFYKDLLTHENSTFVGIEAGFSIALWKKNRLIASFKGISGDVIDQKVKAAIREAYLQLNLPVIKNVSIHKQAGISDASMHLMNYAYVQYRPKYENLAFDFKLGKLQGYDKTPYGVSVLLKRRFNYVELGAFYQLRHNQDPTMPQIAGFTINLLKPKKLVEIWNTYSFWYNFYENSFMFNVPLLKINMRFK